MTFPSTDLLKDSPQHVPQPARSVWSFQTPPIAPLKQILKDHVQPEQSVITPVQSFPQPRPSALDEELWHVLGCEETHAQPCFCDRQKVGQWLRFSYGVKVLALNLQLSSRQETILQFPFAVWQWMHWGERRAGVSITGVGPAPVRSEKGAGNIDKRTNAGKVVCGLWYSYYLWRHRPVDLIRVYCRPAQALICLQSWRKSGRAERWELDGEDLSIHAAHRMAMSRVKDEMVL